MHTPRYNPFRVPEDPVQPVPVAMRGHELVWAADYEFVDLYNPELLCVGCGQPVKWDIDWSDYPHFYHTARKGCGGKRALNTAVIEVVWDSLRQAIINNRDYPLEIACRHCETVTHENLVADTELTLSRYQEVADGVRPDILIRSGTGEPLYAINTSPDPEDEPPKDFPYSRLGIAEIYLPSSWFSIGAFREGFRISAPTQRLTPWPTSGTGYFDVHDVPCQSPRHFETDPALACPVCEATAQRLAIETADANCYECDDEYQILDFVQQTGAGVRRIAASCEDLTGVEMIAADYDGVRLQSTFSQGAERRYLGHFCGNGHFQGDSIIYRREGALDRDRPVQRMIVCPAGHWTKDGPPIPWPANMRMQRITCAVGLWGYPTGVFDPPPPPRPFEWPDDNTFVWAPNHNHDFNN